jgi:hypothetical protein
MDFIRPPFAVLRCFKAVDPAFYHQLPWRTIPIFASESSAVSWGTKLAGGRKKFKQLDFQQDEWVQSIVPPASGKSAQPANVGHLRIFKAKGLNPPNLAAGALRSSADEKDQRFIPH